MLRWILSSIGIVALAAVALVSAQSKIHDYSSLAPFHVGLTTEELEFLGTPHSATERELVYLLPDQSTLVVALEDNKVAAASLELRQPLKIEDPQLKQLRFVQMGMDAAMNPTWFYAAAADRGRIFKVSEQGLIESITWVKPFSPAGPSRQLQALLREFNTQRAFPL
jgi:hypothetical protein